MGPVRLIVGLLDTSALLWAFWGDERTPHWIRGRIDEDASTFGVSDVSVWEIAIKRSAGKLDVPEDLPTRITDLGLAPVPILRRHVWAVRALPLHHRDPFDRLLVAQARDLGVPLITPDGVFAAYDVEVRWER